MIYTVRTRNWYASPHTYYKLTKAKQWGVVVYCDPNDFFDCKFMLETKSKLLAELVLRFFRHLESKSGGMTYMDTNRERF